MAGAKTVAYCSVCLDRRYTWDLLWRSIGPLLYMGPIVAFHWTAAIVLVFCGILQRRYTESPQYMCFRGINLDIAALQKLAAINKAFYEDTIAVV